MELNSKYYYIFRNCAAKVVLFFEINKLFGLYSKNSLDFFGLYSENLFKNLDYSKKGDH